MTATPPSYPSYPDPFPVRSQRGPYGGPLPPPLADWGSRVAAALVDALGPVLIVGVGMLGFVLSDDPGVAVAAAVVGYLGAFTVALWNQGWRQGRTGQSLGKSLVGIRLVRVRDGAPVGFGTALGRQLAHAFDGVLAVGYLRPLWNARRQTFADSICDTVVVRAG